jgi:RecB family exonuclease
MIQAAKPDRPGLWIVPSRLAQVQVLAALGRKQDLCRSIRVWCWSDLWNAVAERRADSPARLGPAGCRAVLSSAVNRARRNGELGATADMAQWPGFRRRLRDQIERWTLQERSLRAEPPRSSPGEPDAWVIYRHYRAILSRLDSEDPAGFVVWASRALAESPPVALSQAGTITLLDLEPETPAMERALRCFEYMARALRISVDYVGDPTLAEVYEATGSRRTRWREEGFDERALEVQPGRPEGLRAVERELFRDDAHRRPRIQQTQGLKLLGAPQGEGLGLVVAREVRRRLTEEAVAPEDVLVLFRRWDDDSETVADVLRSWEIPISTPGRPQTMRTDSTISALRMACNLPREGWESSAIIALLRHGQFRPSWIGDDLELAKRAASDVVRTRVFRGTVAIRAALYRLEEDPKLDHDRIAETRQLVERFIATIEPINQAGTWREHLQRVQDLADRLGFSASSPEALERFWDALEDHASVLDGLGRGSRSMSSEVFIGAVDAIASEVVWEDRAIDPGSVVVTTLDRAKGARARHILLVNLAEGTFPSRESVESSPGRSSSTAYAREAESFLRVIGSAGESLTLVYPTRDEKGQEMLASGFLNMLRMRLDPASLATIEEAHTRFDPALLQHPDLAGAPADTRARAVAMACTQQQTSDLASLAGDRRHRSILTGTAAALQLEHVRSARANEYSTYEGLLGDDEVVRSVAARFNAEVAFSPSQLETYLACPFRFFMQYVMKLEPVKDHDDLAEDRTERGSRVHKALEDLEKRKLEEAGNFLEVDAIRSTTEFLATLTYGAEAEPGRREIERRWLVKTLQTYQSQVRAMAAKPQGDDLRPRHFELEFGPGEDASYPCFTVGLGAEAVKLRGTIDRVDIINQDGETLFRIIDYKTGATPSKRDIDEAFVLQLPIYAQALESFDLEGQRTRLLAMGYWDLKDKGYKPIDLATWPALRAKIEAKVLETAASIRKGAFAVDPASKDCTRTCDFATVCRIRQVRTAKQAREAETS